MDGLTKPNNRKALLLKIIKLTENCKNNFVILWLYNLSQDWLKAILINQPDLFYHVLKSWVKAATKL